jgi:hypothetical protein
MSCDEAIWNAQALYEKCAKTRGGDDAKKAPRHATKCLLLVHADVNADRHELALRVPESTKQP